MLKVFKKLRMKFKTVDMLVIRVDGTKSIEDKIVVIKSELGKLICYRKL